MVEFALVLSVLINIFLVWYARNTLSNLLYLSDNLGLLYEVVSAYNLHLKEVYELERFYGDPTLSYLLEHTNAVREELAGYEEIFLLAEPEETEEPEQEVEPDGKEEA
jgi:hypothetical protein